MDWASAKNILAIRLDTIGDVLMTTPALRAVKETLPESRLTLMTSPGGVQIAALVPEIDETLEYQAPWLKATAPRHNSRQEYQMAEHLRGEKFDAAIIFTVFSQNPLPSAFLAYLADIPLRLAHCHENPYQMLTDWVKDPEPEQGIRHEVQRQLELVRAVGFTTVDERLSLQVPVEASLKIREALQTAGIDQNKPWAVLHPGASAESRRYAPEGYAKAASSLSRVYGIPIVLTGAPAELGLVKSIQAQMSCPSVSLAGALDLAGLSALIEQASIVITNNTGPAHIAAAVGTPVVDLYALTNPQHTPWMVASRVLNHDVDCKYCFKSVCPMGHHNCLRLVDPEEIVRAAVELVHAGKSAPFQLDAGLQPVHYHYNDIESGSTL